MKRRLLTIVTARVIMVRGPRHSALSRGVLPDLSEVMRFTIVNRDGRRASFEADDEVSLGGDPDRGGIAPGLGGAWNGWLRLEPDGWVLIVIGHPCACNGAPINGAVMVREGDVIEVGGTTIRFDRLPRPVAPAPLLSDTERALLAQIGDDLSDDQARRVLSDHWQGGFDAARGELVRLQCERVDASALIQANRQRWLRTAMAAGFAGAALDFARGFARAALVVEDGEPLDGCPDGVRLSPRQYRVVGSLRDDGHRRVFEAVARTAAGDVPGRYVLKLPQPHDVEFDTMERELAILSRVDHPNVTPVVDLALVRPDAVALVLPWAGIPLQEVIEGAREPREPLAISIGLALCDALAALHRHGILHRQIQPDHVLVAEDGHVTLTGFGRAKAPGVDPPPEDPERRWRPDFRYMSYEQVRGLVPGPPGDVFSLALVIAALAQGRDPIATRYPDFEILSQIWELRYQLPSGTPLADLLRRTIVRDSAERPSLAELAAELARIGAHDRALIARTVAQLPAW